jgi:hypothetical protein
MQKSTNGAHDAVGRLQAQRDGIDQDEADDQPLKRAGLSQAGGTGAQPGPIDDLGF